MFNLNFTQTILTVLIFAAAVLPTVFGCTVDPLGVADCSGSWLPASWSAMLVGGLAMLKFVIKFFQGGTGDTVGKALVAPMVVISEKGLPGTVTMTQVNSTSKK